MDKQAIRERIWDRLEDAGEARFPYPPHGRIPNFAGASAAADRVSTLEWWTDAACIKANPDAPQLPLRRQALAAGKTVVMARPRLADDRPFLVLDPDGIDDTDNAATIGGAAAAGEPVRAGELPPIDAIVVGSVAVDRSGRRIGKGEGYSDLEFGLLLASDRITREVPVTTTVHPIQISDETLPDGPHDVPVDYVSTPDTVLHAINRPTRPSGIITGLLDDEKIDEIPALATLDLQ